MLYTGAYLSIGVLYYQNVFKVFLVQIEIQVDDMKIEQTANSV